MLMAPQVSEDSGSRIIYSHDHLPAIQLPIPFRLQSLLYFPIMETLNHASHPSNATLLPPISKISTLLTYLLHLTPLYHLPILLTTWLTQAGKTKKRLKYIIPSTTIFHFISYLLNQSLGSYLQNYNRKYHTLDWVSKLRIKGYIHNNTIQHFRTRGSPLWV